MVLKVPASNPGHGLRTLFAFDRPFSDQRKCHSFTQESPISDLKTDLKSGQCRVSFGLSQKMLEYGDILGTYLPENRTFTLYFHQQASSKLRPTSYNAS